MVVSAAVGDQLSTTETFGEFFDAWLRRRRPYLEPGTYIDYEIHGRKRLAELRPLKLTKLSTATVETWLVRLAEKAGMRRRRSTTPRRRSSRV